MIEKKEVEIQATSNLGEASTDIEKFAQKVFKKILEENVYPIPYYYSIYFFNMLEDESSEFKKSILEIVELESTNELEEDLKFEQKLKQSFKYSKEIIQNTAFTYKLLATLKEKNNLFLKEIENVSTPQVFKNILSDSKKNIELINKKLEQTLSNIKEIYSKNVQTLKEIEKESIFDAVYGLYNNNYFLKELKKEIAQIKKFKHISSLIVVKPTDEILKKIKTEKSKKIISKFIAKILLKTSRRTDVVAHLGNGIFGMLLKHTDRIGAIRTSERLSDIISNSTMFIEDNELEVHIAIGISEILSQKSEIDIVNCAYDKLEEAQKDNVLYKVCEE